MSNIREFGRDVIRALAREPQPRDTDARAAVERVERLCADAESKGITSGHPFTVEAVRAALAGDA